jgi:methionyl aminopeptidase
MKIYKTEKSSNLFCIVHNQEWLEQQRIAGKVVAQALLFLEANTTKYNGLKLSKLAEEIILDNKCTPTFKGYNGFPEAVCISINNELVHGIPKEINFNDSDIVSFDLGATFNGAIADSAITIIIGENKRAEKLLQATKQALFDSIKAINLESKIGVIGETIYKVGKYNNMQVINNYGGHFIALNEPHAKPFVANKDNKNNGIRFQEGMSLAIEPLFCLGLNNETKVAQDKWTVITNDLSAHFEETIFIHKDKVEIITSKE